MSRPRFRCLMLKTWLRLAFVLTVFLNIESVFAAEIEVVNKTFIDAGDFPLRVDIENDVIFMRGKFLSRTVTGVRIIGGVVLDVILQDADGQQLSRVTVPVPEYKIGLWFEHPIGTVLPREGGIRKEVLRRVIVTANRFRTTEDEARERQQEREGAARRLAEEQKASARLLEEKRNAAEAARQASIRAKGWPKNIEASVIGRQIWIGMSREQARLSLGDPGSIHETIRASGKTEYWTYGSLGLLFEGDRLMTIHRSR